MHESLLAYGRFRYLRAALLLVLLVTVAYFAYVPPEPRNGGTWLGYTLGGLGAALILWLIALGVRKRSYASTLGTVQGWVSAHVYLGTALLVVVTLHTGFQFGWNIHTIAFALMCGVIASGAFGVYAYLRFPEAMSSNRASQTRAQMLAELADLDRLCLRLAAGMPAEFAEAVASNRDRTAIGGGALALLAGRDSSRILLPDGALVANPDQDRFLDWLGARLAGSTDGQLTRQVQELMTLVGGRRALLGRLRRDARLRAWLDVWLYVHVPLSFALLAALMAHVVVVFLYW